MKNQYISIVRGTTNAFGINITDAEGNIYTLETDQVLVFGVKRKPTDLERVLVKTITHSVNGDYYLELTPADTELIEPGKYFYDVGLQQGESVFYNVIEASVFEIKPNITELGDGS
jgi:hypothetical protein